MQVTSAESIRPILDLFPIREITVDTVVDNLSSHHSRGGNDNIEAFVALGYLMLTVQCRRCSKVPVTMRVMFDEQIPQPRYTGAGAGAGGGEGNEALLLDDEDATTTLSIIVFEDWIVTIHRYPIEGMMEILRRVQMEYTRKQPRRHGHGAAGNPAAPAAGTAGGGGGAGDSNGAGGDVVVESADAGGGMPVNLSDFRDSHVPLMTTSWVLATAIEFVTETFLPDPTALLTQVDSVDELVLLIPGEQSDQADLLRRIADLRRKISSKRVALFRKEQLVQQLLMPSMRNSFVSRQSSIAEQYRHTVAQVGHILERLDSARDVLNQANANFLQGISMTMAQSSTQMTLKMTMLSQVATLCLPLSIVTGAFGMNVTVPFQTDREPSLTAFAVILGCMGLWLTLWLPSIFSTFLQIRKEQAKRKRRAHEEAEFTT